MDSRWDMDVDVLVLRGARERRLDLGREAVEGGLVGVRHEELLVHVGRRLTDLDRVREDPLAPTAAPTRHVLDEL